ncbi:4267_t:CDS:1, partial [Racocetra fulgida]
MISLASELADDINGLELSSTVDVDESPGEIANKPPGEIADKPPGEIADKPPEAANELPGAATEPPGAAVAKKPLPRTRKVL